MNFPNWHTYLVTQASLSEGRSTLEIVEAAIDGGIDAVQLREKDTDARRRYELGLEVRDLTAEAGVDLIVNDRVDIARAIDADGVHVGQSDLPVAVARDLLGPDAIVGCSASTVEEAREAEAEGADYLGVGTIYGTTSKDVDPEKDRIGPERVADIADAVSIPIVGIGGITADNAGPIVEAGATGVAVISEITAAEDPRAATEALARAVETATPLENGGIGNE
ncbi:thiamine phosphate synthase [Halopiger thermotolerans]